MPTYEYRCKNCDNRFSLFYKTYDAYDQAEPACPRCESTQLARLIGSVAIPRPARDYGKMSSGEMLSVLESGDSRQVGEMFEQIGGTDPAMGKQMQETTERLLKGESMAKVEKDLQASEKNKPNAAGS